jgi:selenocysteine-specific elongation factor
VQVIATAGHVDHGKSALVRALTGMEPDRWAEERRRGMTIDLGYAWLTLPSGEQLAFVDVPGHERFVPNMLAGVGPVPGVLFVVAADGGWMPQSAEHLAVLSALGISRVLLAVTRCDLAGPAPAMAAAAAEFAAAGLGPVPAFAVSAVTGTGLPQLVSGLAAMAAGLPVPPASAAVRLWVDRAFSITGSGTVVTGTLPAGTVRAGDELLLAPLLRPVRVRALELLGRPAASASGVARVALNLRGVSRDGLRRGMALLQADRWALTSLLDVRLSRPGSRPGQPKPPRDLTVHTGSARVTARLRVLGGEFARLTLADPLPLHIGDRLLLRDPGAAGPGGYPEVMGATVLDVAPPPLARPGGAAAAAAELESWPARPGATELLRRHGLMRAGELRAMGAGELPAPLTGDWLVDPGRRRELERQLARAVAEHAAASPLAPGLPVGAAQTTIGVPEQRLVTALARAPLTVSEGILSAADGPGHRPEPGRGLPPAVLAAVQALRRDLAAAPFRAPDAGRLREAGLGAREIAAAQRAGMLLRVSDQIVLAPDAAARAAGVLAVLPQPFTTAQARVALDTTRRVAIPLLEYLDRAGTTQRLPDDRRRLRQAPGPP